MLGKAASYINVEEAQTARCKANKAPTLANKFEKRLPQPPAQPLSRVWDARPPFGPGQDPRPAPRVAAVQAPKLGPRGPRYCTYHQSHTHATSDCFQFARDSRCAAELGLPLLEIAPRTQQMMLAIQQEPGEAREEENRGNATIREIDMIPGGPTDRDYAWARKSHERCLEIHVVWCSQEQAAGPVIRFGPQDLEGLEFPHDDALIIKAIIANSRVARVFVDTGSSVNVLFKSAFESMQIDASELQPVTTSLYGFTAKKYDLWARSS
ncbi:uncharacterized protein LOC122037764 [Zingiber officinale]|uniref:uncharacterized protein LOC122037764 n=1 Tax=Zingiber officinale TaxID=94328 RepID=UPI001C4D01E3|nr:uncharacterized protein LOC122037764 [Zingiber officinale]